MKYINLLVIVAFTGSFIGCIVEDLKEVTPATPAANLTAPQDIAFFAGITDEVTFDVELAENPGITISSVVVTKQLITTIGDSSPAQFTFSGSSISQSKDALFADVPVSGEVLTEDDLEPGDTWVFDYKLELSDGRTLTIPASGSTTITFQCLSDLAGTYDFESTNIQADNASTAGCSEPVVGTGTITETGDGLYEVSDATFGQYDCAWDDTPAVGVTLTDVCGVVTVGGSDQYGLIYSFKLVDNDGTSLTLDWSNDYGDRGRVKLTRTDGKTWPDGLTFN